MKNNIKFTSSLHTKFAEYVNKRTHIPVSIGYSFLRYFHKPANKILVTTKNMENELTKRKRIGDYAKQPTCPNEVIKTLQFQQPYQNVVPA